MVISYKFWFIDDDRIKKKAVIGGLENITAFCDPGRTYRNFFD